jgi:hypothetical protein
MGEKREGEEGRGRRGGTILICLGVGLSGCEGVRRQRGR